MKVTVLSAHTNGIIDGMQDIARQNATHADKGPKHAVRSLSSCKDTLREFKEG